MQPILNVVLPVFAIIATGYLCGRLRLLGAESSDALNRFVYWVALPVLLFRGMARVEPSELLNGAFIGAYAGGIVILWIVSMAVARFVFGTRLAEGALHGMNSVYGNTGYMGIPLAMAAFGEAATVPVIITVVINAALVVGVATVLIEIGRDRAAGPMRLARDVVAGLLGNPIFVAPILGVAWASTGASLPEPVDAFTRILGAAAGPAALFAIGLFLVGRPLRHGLGEVGLMTAAKLFAQPAITLALVVWVFPMDSLWTAVAVLMAGLPTGAGAFVLAQAYGLYVQRTSSVILISTVLSVATISALLLWLPAGN